MLLKAADNLTKNDQKCWSQPGFEPGAFQREKKVRNFRLKLYHCATEADTLTLLFYENQSICTVVCIKVHKIVSLWCKTALGEVGVSLP